MSKFLKIGLIEFKQQSRRKAVWIGVLAGLLYNIYQDLVCIHMGLNVFIDNDITISNSAARLTGMTLFILVTVLCSDRILKDKKNDCFDILYASPMKKAQYYFGKMLSDIVFFGIIGLFFMICMFVEYKTAYHNELENFSIKYFVLFYLTSDLSMVIYAVAFSYFFTNLFGNSILTVVVTALYFQLPILIGPMNPFQLYFGLFPSYIQEFLQNVTDPVQFKELNPYSKLFEQMYPDHFSEHKVIISIYLFIGMIMFFCVIGYVIFRIRSGHQGRKLKDIINSYIKTQVE